MASLLSKTYCLESVSTECGDLHGVLYCVQGNAIYNIMADVISRLSDPEIGISEQHFDTIMRSVTILNWTGPDCTGFNQTKLD